MPVNFDNFLTIFGSSTNPLLNVVSKLLTSLDVKFPVIPIYPKFQMKKISPYLLKSGAHIDFYIMAFSCGILLFSFIEKIYRRKTKKLILKSILKKFKWNYVVRYILVAICPLSFSCFLQLRFPCFDSPLATFSYILAVFSTVLLAGFIVKSIMIIKNKYAPANRDYIREKYGSLFERYPTAKGKPPTKMVQYFVIVNLMRRVTFVGCIVFAYYQSFLCLALLSCNL